MNRGQLWTYILGSRHYRVLIVSNDEFNEVDEIRPWGLAVERIAVTSELLVPLTTRDPLAGAVVNASVVYRLDRAGLRDNHGLVSHGTMEAVEDALREFLGLP